MSRHEEHHVTTDEPGESVGIVIVRRLPDGSLSGTWSDTTDRVPITLRQAAQMLSILAASLEVRAAELDGGSGG